MAEYDRRSGFQASTPNSIEAAAEEQANPAGISISERLDAISLSETHEAHIREKAVFKAVKEATAGLFPTGQVLKALFKIGEDYKSICKEQKMIILFDFYLKKTDSLEEGLSRTADFLRDPFGQALYEKYKMIVSSAPPDPSHLDRLASVLKNIVFSDFQDMFSLHKYALSQIDQMTPQALSMIAMHDHWPMFYLPTPATAGKKVISDYVDEFAMSYAEKFAMRDENEIERLKHCVSELLVRRYIEAYQTGEDHARCQLTKVGGFVLTYWVDRTV